MDGRLAITVSVAAFLAAASAGALVTFLYLKSAVRRRRCLARIARKMDFAFRANADSMLKAWFNHFPLFRSGVRPTIRNAMKGRFLNADVRVLDFGAFTDRRRVTTVAVFRFSKSRVPRFVLWPATFVGEAELPLEERERVTEPDASARFTELYRLHGSNAGAVRKLLHPRVVKFLETHPGWWIEGGGRWLSVYQYNSRPAPARMPAFVRDAFQVFRVFRLT